MSAPYDVVLYGATGFTGRQAAAYFAAHAPPGLRWAVAARHEARLREIAAATGAPGVIVADSSDAASVDAMVRQARVLLTTAGPYAKYGAPVVAACVEHRVDYVDITGETPWVRDLVDRHHERAAADGTRVVPFCGFDSVPSDLGALYVVEHFRARGKQTRRLGASFTMRGGLNGGTLDTMLTAAEQGRLGELADVLLLNPPAHRTEAERARSGDRRAVGYDADRRAWLAPFVMAAINTRVVRRSAALSADYGAPYGAAFVYEEAMELASRTSAWLAAGAVAGANALVQRGWGRRLARRFGPAPGEGPSEKTMDGGSFRVRIVGEADDGEKVLATLKSAGDPGNRVTVYMLCESALALATERDRLPGAPSRGGILTPATALGLPLLARLRTAGLETTVAPLG